MEIEFSQRIGQTTIRFRKDLGVGEWSDYQACSEFWQRISEYELSLLPESEQAGSSFKKLKR